MIASRLEYPIFTFDHQELHSTGAVLSTETVAELIAKNNSEEESYALFAYGRAKQDLFHFISQPPYNNIFSNPKMNDVVLKNSARVIFLEAKIKDMQESMEKQEKQIAIRDAKIEKLKDDLQRETKERKDAVKLLKKSFTQIQNLVNSAQYLTVIDK